MWNDLKNLLKAFYIFAKHLFEALGNLLVRIISFLGPAENSIKKVISPEEFYRVLMLAFSSSGSLYGFVQYLSTHLNEFVTDPNLISSWQAFITHIKEKHIPMAVFVVIFTLDYIRRKYAHGNEAGQ